MSTKHDAWKAGIIVIGGLAIGLGFIGYLGGPAYFWKKIPAETYIAGSITGIAIGSTVTLRGVNVGQVTDLTFPGIFYGGTQDLFNPEYGSWVMVRFTIEAESAKQSEEDLEELFKSAVSQGLRARVTMTGLTGGAVLELSIAAPDTPPAFVPAWTPETLYIPGAPSMFDSFVADISVVLDKLANFDLDGISVKLNTLLASADSIVKGDGAELIAGLRKNSAALELILQNPDVARGLKNIADASGNIDVLVQSNGPAVRELIQSLNATIENLEALSAQLKQDPSSIIFTGPPAERPPSSP
ncbi:MAG: MlaD family protein [Planctomycetota bacterium]|nr:MlaD family protein [Planctomycetota bacterium]